MSQVSLLSRTTEWSPHFRKCQSRTPVTHIDAKHEQIDNLQRVSCLCIQAHAGVWCCTDDPEAMSLSNLRWAKSQCWGLQNGNGHNEEDELFFLIHIMCDYCLGLRINCRIGVYAQFYISSFFGLFDRTTVAFKRPTLCMAILDFNRIIEWNRTGFLASIGDSVVPVLHLTGFYEPGS